MTKRERAIRAARNEAEKRGWLFDTPVHAADLGAIIDAAMAIMAEPDEPPEGKLRVRIAVGVLSQGDAFWRGHSGRSFDEQVEWMRETSIYASEAQFRWIEADVTPWQPPAEETVQGREVEE